jgi:hypothetical protein
MTPIGLDIVEMFGNRQRLKDGMAIVNEGRHHMLRVHVVIARLESLAGKDIDCNLPAGQSLEPQRDPHAK